MALIEQIKKKIRDGKLLGSDLPAILDAIVELATTNEDLVELVNDMRDEGDDIWVNFKIPSVGVHCLEIKDGTVKHLANLVEEPTVTITTDRETAVGVISGSVDPVEAYNAGKLKLEGNLAKATGLVLLLNVVGDEFGLELDA